MCIAVHSCRYAFCPNSRTLTQGSAPNEPVFPDSRFNGESDISASLIMVSNGRGGRRPTEGLPEAGDCRIIIKDP